MPTAKFQVKNGEKYKAAPTVSFVIAEDGKVRKVKLVRSSGIRDIDRNAIKTVRKWKYNSRPGCEAVEVLMTITIHFR